MNKLRRFAVVFLLSIALTSCDLAHQETRKVVSDAATSINGEFVLVRQAQEVLVTNVTELYGRLDQLDLSTKGMDAADGGLYQTFPGNKYYYKSKPTGSTLYLSPGKPVTEEIRRQVKFLEFVDPFLIEAGKASDVQAIAFYGVREPMSIALMSPWFDVVSTLPPGIDLNMFEWYQRGLKSSGPAQWSAKPFTDLATGWVMDVSIPVNVAGVNKGVGVGSVSLTRLAAKYLKSAKPAIVLMGADTTVVGLSPAAVSLLGIPVLESYDFLKQTKENTFVPGKYRLDDPSQNAEISSLGKILLSGKNEFEVTLGGKSYQVLRQPLSENSMSVVGFTPR